jgi:hypothetical protein
MTRPGPRWPRSPGHTLCCSWAATTRHTRWPAARPAPHAVITGQVNGQPALASFGSLCLVSALIASATGHPSEANERLAEAQAVAERVGEAGPDVSYFGPTNVGLYRMATALERGEADQAAELADAINTDHIASSERRAKFWLDDGRALSALRSREDDAVAAFHRSQGLAALRLRSNVYARETVTGLLPRLHRDTSTGRELRGIAYRMGIPA